MSTHQTTLSPKEKLSHCIELHQEGRLKAEHLHELSALLDQSLGKVRQDLLYLQTLFSSVTSSVNGIALIENGQTVACPEDPDQWPYQSVLDAINDGWRVISFPNLALMMDKSETYGMGCEFILERLTWVGDS